MKYIESLREGERINEIYLCKVKQSALTKAGKPYNTNRQGLQSVPTEVRKNKHGESVKKFMIFQTICSLEKVC